MGAGEVAPGRVPADGDQPVRAEIVHQSEHTRVTRLFLPEGTVICKEPLGPDAERRVRHEAAMLQRLRGVTGVAQLVETPRYPGPIVLADAGGVSLAGVARPLPADDLAVVAVGLARAVTGMHARGVIHRDITPANVVLSGGGVPCLVDFALATSLAEIRPEFTHHARIAGTLAYLAPEQTGRTGRPVDHRADLYALGATLYELATGQPPFGVGDPLRLTHDHLARVPVPPADRNPAIPAALSQVIMHLLEKEPDHRYQTADGVVHDLERLRAARAHPAAVAMFRAGEQDVPLRLVPPSRLVGRETQVAALEEAFEQALAGGCRVLLISGAPGVGKTALADELRPVVTGRDGWFVTGKFDQYRRDLEFDGVYQSFRALGRLLLAEPEQELAAVSERILAGAGANAGLAAAIVPEFAALLAVPPDPGDPLTAQVRAQRVSVQLLRAVASRKRPLVFFVDDLQWAGRTPLGLFDLALSEDPVEGLLLVGAYREQDVDATHLLAPMVARWRQQAGLHQVRLEDLPVSDLAGMVAEMLHVDRAVAAALADVIGPYTSGNPYQTVELLNALRRDGVLIATAAGWRWDAAAVRAHLGRSDVAGLLAGRVAALPTQSQAVLEAMACLGGRAELSLLQAATGESAAMVERALSSALDDGLLVMEAGTNEAVRFRHDRIREVILDQVDPQRRRTVQLAMARQLAGVPELSAVAAEQYLPVVDGIAGAAERRQVAALLRRAAEQAAMIGDYAQVNALLSAAARLIDSGETATLIEVHAARHAALYSLGRLDEADEEYRTIEQLCLIALDRADATAVQVRSLTNRNRLAEAIGLGLESLRELGVAVPAAGRLPAELDQQFEYLYRWLDHTSAADDLVRPEITDPTMLAAARLVNATYPAAYVAGEYATVLWLTLETLRIWLEHGPHRTLLGTASTAAFHAVAARGDHSGGYRALRRLLDVGEARGYEPDTSQARYLFAAISYWFEPIENGVQAAQRAREGLIAGGDLAMAGYTYATAAAYLVDCAPTLESLAAEVEAGLAFVRRTGDEMMGQVLDDYRWLAGVLRGERSAAAGEAATTGRYADNPLALLYIHLSRAIAAAIFGDAEDLARHTAAAMPLLSATPGLYLTAVAYLLRGLALSRQAGITDCEAQERAGLLSELDEVTGWLAARTADAPDNFLHLLRLLEAERAWADGDFLAAALAFDTARREVARRQRPWHRALITERAGRFHLTHGLDHAGYDLLAQARQAYSSWGAAAKVAQLDWAYPTLRPGAGTTAGPGADQSSYLPHGRATVTIGTIDLLGILSASQALSSETSIGRLHTRVGEVLGAMTGATGVHLLLWSEDRQDWLLPAAESGGAPVSSTSREHAIPTSVLRYAQRTREPLVIADATRDDRFARDPYFADVGCCALLAVPIVSRGALQAVLVLENRLIRGAFSTERLDAVQLIAGQLAVSLDNAQLYAELTASRARIVAVADQARRRMERNLHDGAQQRLVSLGLQLRAVQATMPPEMGAQLDQVADGLTGALEELGEIARGIHPSVLTDGGLRPALKTLGRRSPVPVKLDIRVRQRLPEQVEVSAYYFVAEALTNAAKHARASSVTVTAEADAAVLRVAVRDDGAGGADFTRGTGLVGLKDRVEAIGGRLFLDSPPGAGTSLRAEFPLAR
jgi:predicted ATPase/signal transduction histidine kinase